MKKVILYVSILCFVFVISFFGYKHSVPQELRLDGKLKLYTLEELEKTSTIIVKASLKEKVSTDIVFDNEKVPYDYRTFSNLEIDEIYENNDTSLKIGDKIKVVEWYANWRDLSGAYTIISSEQYIPLKSNMEYVLFLYQEPGKEYYEIIGVHQGKYTFDNYIAQENESSLGKLSTLEIQEYDEYYINNFKLVYDKYIKQ